MTEIHICVLNTYVYTHGGWWETQVCAGTSYGNVVFMYFFDDITVHSRFFERKVLVPRWSAGATGCTEPRPPPSGSVPWESIDLGGGGSEVLGLLGWGGGGWEEVEDDLMLAPHPPGWSCGVPAAGNWTSFSSPRTTWGRRRGSGRPSVMGGGGWPGGPVSGSRSPGVEPLASEAGPANDKELSERAGWGGSNGVSAGGRRQKKQDGFKVRNLNERKWKKNEQGADV